jgi:glycosyltransferase involved in cell wall biosynthesis
MAKEDSLFMKKYVGFYICLCIYSFLFSENKHFVFIVTSYNNEQFAERNLDSLVSAMLHYPNSRIIYVDDCSKDGTTDVVARYIKKHGLEDKITFIRNTERHYKLYNFYNAIHTCSDYEIAIEVDGDDVLARIDALCILNTVYQNDQVWVTYGSYINDNGSAGLSMPIPKEIIENNTFRDYPRWNCGHLRTFYVWLFKLIKKEDLFYQEHFFTMSGDQAYFYPLLEMASERCVYIKDVLYIYTTSGNLHDHKVNQRFQKYLARLIQLRPKYARLEKATIMF